MGYLLLLVSMVIFGIRGFPDFRNQIPNGDKVPNPCNTSQIWTGVGHLNADGGGDRNPFGEDFSREGKKWTKRLCQGDSDQDGKTNGEELGDPRCNWSPGYEPDRNTDISHPGICEPIESEACMHRNTWLNCSVTGDCPALKEQGLVMKELRIPLTTVPAEETTYMCRIFEFPVDGDYHLVATTPIIDNKQITHHILLFGCDESGGEISLTSKAYKCGMLAHPKCIYIIGTWTIGSNGDCMHEDTGFRIGSHGFKHAAIQVHWNNPKKISEYTDSSGMMIYLSEKKRSYDAGMLSVGLEYLVIPPAQQEVGRSSVCPGDCTSAMFPTPVYITRAVNHMHYMGIRQTISLYRSGAKVTDITHDQDYHYDRPKFYSYDPPIQVLPGDEFRTECTYTSVGKNKTIYFGQATSDEMCFGFITYYPKQNIRIPYCTTWKSVQKCRRYLPEFKGIYENCKWMEFLNKTNPKTLMMVATLRKLCSELEITGSCPDSCIKKVEEYRTHPCLTGDLGDFLIFKMSKFIPNEVKYLKQCRNMTIVENEKLNIDETDGLNVIQVVNENRGEDNGGKNTGIITGATIYENHITILIIFFLNNITKEFC